MQSTAATARPVEPLMLSLSGGGVRATLFHLGLLAHLSEQRRLRDVQLIVSVSGGSILAAHFAKHWLQAIEDDAGFIEVALSLITFCRSGIRNRVLVPWMWTRLLPVWWIYKWSKSAFLERSYRRHFGDTTLGDLPKAGAPLLAIVATDSIRGERVVFTAEKVLRIPIQADETGDPALVPPIISKGVRLATAVAASSCFPPVFNPIPLGHEALNLTYQEFKEKLVLKDGGIAGNLGIEVLLQLTSGSEVDAPWVLLSDAERPTTVQPKSTPIADITATGIALSEAARERLRRERRGRSSILRFSRRDDSDQGLPFVVETKLLSFRTDLDGPSWKEIYALMLHGACVARNSVPHVDEGSGGASRERIKRILVAAGAPKDLELPEEADLKRCGDLPKTAIAIHGILLLTVLAVVGYMLFPVALHGFQRLYGRVASSNDDLETLAAFANASITDNILHPLGTPRPTTAHADYYRLRQAVFLSVPTWAGNKKALWRTLDALGDNGSLRKWGFENGRADIERLQIEIDEILRCRLSWLKENALVAIKSNGVAMQVELPRLAWIDFSPRNGQGPCVVVESISKVNAEIKMLEASGVPR